MMHLRDALRSSDLRKIGKAVFSDGMLSFAHAVIGILIAKYTAKDEYAIYIIMFSFIGILGGYQNALVNAPLTVVINLKDPAEQRRYIAALGGVNTYIVFPLMLAAIAAFSGYAAWNHLGITPVVQVIAVSAASYAFLTKDYVRSLNLVTLHANAILAMDALTLVVIFVALGGMILTGALSASMALFVLAAGYGAAFVYGKVAGGFNFRSRFSSAFDALKENWVHGKWASLGATCSLAQDRGYIYLVSVFLGLATLADLSAARIFFLPFSLLNQSTARVLFSKGSQLIADNKFEKYRAFVFWFTASLTAMWLVYSVAVWMASGSIVSGLLGAKYANTGDALLLWALFFGIYTVRRQLGSALGVYRQFEQLARYDVIGCVGSLVSCVVLILTIGRLGAIWALIIGEVVTAGLYTARYRAFRPQRVTLDTIAVSEDVVG